MKNANAKRSKEARFNQLKDKIERGTEEPVVQEAKQAIEAMRRSRLAKTAGVNLLFVNAGYVRIEEVEQRS